MTLDARDDIRVLHLPADGPLISTSDDTSDLIGTAWAERATVIAIPVSRLDPEFFSLRSGIAGEITLKFVNYRLKLAVVGDISEYTDASDALRDFVWESNRGQHVWFVADEAALADKLARARTRTDARTRRTDQVQSLAVAGTADQSDSKSSIESATAITDHVPPSASVNS